MLTVFLPEFVLIEDSREAFQRIFIPILLKHGALFDIQDKNNGWTALHYTVDSCPAMWLIEMIVQAEKEVINIKDKKGRTPLDLYLEMPEKDLKIKALLGGTSI